MVAKDKAQGLHTYILQDRQMSEVLDQGEKVFQQLEMAGQCCDGNVIEGNTPGGD
jgi:hypothetical protein